MPPRVSPPAEEDPRDPDGEEAAVRGDLGESWGDDRL
jgi:hypothetical protein